MLSLFRSWCETDLRYVNVNCKMAQYEHESIVYNEDDMSDESIYFVTSGSCQIIKVSE